MSFNRGFPSKVVPEGFQVGVYVGPHLGRRLGGLLERSWEAFGRPRCAPRRSKTAPGRAKTALRHPQDGQKWPQGGPKTRYDAATRAKDAKMMKF